MNGPRISAPGRSAGGVPGSPPADHATGLLVGIEHEFRVMRPDGEQVDFSGLIHGLKLDGVRLDPGDTNAYRLRSGMVITADGAEAEIATPPIAVLPGFASRAAAVAGSGRRALQSALPAGLRLEGYSTHISVSLPGGERAFAHAYATTFAPVLALLMESPASQGVYVRPRPGRLEVCADFVTGPRLAASVAFAVASVRALDACPSWGGACCVPRLELQLAPCRERFGYRVHRMSPGFDMYEYPRTARFGLLGGGEITGQELLCKALGAVKTQLECCVSEPEMRWLRRAVRGDGRLGVEEPAGTPHRWRVHGFGPSPGRMERPAEGAVVDVIARPSFLVRPAVATWEFTVLELRSGKGSAYLPVLREHLPETLSGLRAGAFDEAAAEFFARGTTEPVLETRGDLRERRLFASVKDPAALLAPEPSPDPLAARNPAKPGRPGGSRPGKSIGWLTLPAPVVPAQPPTVPPAPFWQRPVVRAVTIGVGIAIVSGWVLVGLLPGLDRDADGSGTVVGSPTPATGPTSLATVVSPPTALSGGATPAATPSAVTPTHAAATGTSSAGATLPPGPSATPIPTAAPLPTATPTEVPAPTSSPVATVRPTETPLPTFTPTPTPTSTPTPTPTVRPTEPPPPADTPTPPPEPAETVPPPTPTSPGGGPGAIG